MRWTLLALLVLAACRGRGAADDFGATAVESPPGADKTDPIVTLPEEPEPFEPIERTGPAETTADGIPVLRVEPARHRAGDTWRRSTPTLSHLRHSLRARPPDGLREIARLPGQALASGLQRVTA